MRGSARKCEGEGGGTTGTTHRFEILEIGVNEFASEIDQLIAVYAAAMRPPADQLIGRHAIMAGHTNYPRFRALTATADHRLAGFCYGFHGVAGQWWHDRVRRGLATSHGPEVAQAWLADSLELAELHVRPEFQGRGIGVALLRGLPAGRRERTVLLSTHDTESVARRLYRNTGFTDLLTGFWFDGADTPYAVMGAELPLRGCGGRQPAPGADRSHGSPATS
ncbi:MAG TPA: GNAT family N-acetyltransferase [Streptosporangiaceae bacterium]